MRTAIAALLALAACGLPADKPDQKKEPEAPTKTTIGAAGGKVTRGAMTLAIPQGLLTADKEITVATSTAVLPEGAESLTTLLDFGPAGTTFSSPITVEFEIPTPTLQEGESVNVLWSTADAKSYEFLPTAIIVKDANTWVLRALVDHFSTAGVLRTGPGTHKCTCKKGYSGDSKCADPSTTTSFVCGDSMAIATATIGNEGGKLTTTGLEVIVPPKALRDPVELTAWRVPPPGVLDSTKFAAFLSPAWQVGPEDAKLEAPISLELATMSDPRVAENGVCLASFDRFGKIKAFKADAKEIAKTTGARGVTQLGTFAIVLLADKGGRCEETTDCADPTPVFCEALRKCVVSSAECVVKLDCSANRETPFACDAANQCVANAEACEVLACEKQSLVWCPSKKSCLEKTVACQ